MSRLLAIKVVLWRQEMLHGSSRVYSLVTPSLLLLSHFSHVRLCDPIDGSPPGSPVPGIFQARTLGWVAVSFSNAWKWKVKVKLLSRVWLPHYLRKFLYLYLWRITAFCLLWILPGRGGEGTTNPLGEELIFSTLTTYLWSSAYKHSFQFMGKIYRVWGFILFAQLF